MTEISQSASKFVASYAKAMALGADPSISLKDVTQALAEHYPVQRPFTAFTSGHTFSAPDRAHIFQGIWEHLGRFVRSGLGTNIAMESHRIEVVSDGSALCWITWGIKPKDGTEGWTWENVYGYRKPVEEVYGSPDGYWEFAVSDQEIAKLLQRKPEFMQN
jgi:hypothetical protein